MVPRTGKLHALLRETTRAAHERLESALNLLMEPIPEARVVHLLERFYGFHAAWEPALEGVVPASLLRPRLKLPLLRHDLQSLGLDAKRLDSLPACADAAILCASEAAAAGALYVLEGSTLGGRIIGRTLEAAHWYPAQRLLYWEPYGSDIGRRWSETLAYLDSLPPGKSDVIVQGAVATFDLLRAWLPHPPTEEICDDGVRTR